MPKRLVLVAATQWAINPKVKKWLKLLPGIFKNCDIVLLSNNILKPAKICNIRELQIDMDGSLFDFSRYESSLHCMEIRDSDIVMIFNDTLGNGRKFGFFLFLFLLRSIFIVKRKPETICGPLDKDAHGSWLCPYFIIGNAAELKRLNFTDFKHSESNLNIEILSKINIWVYNDWRNAHASTDDQKATKLKTLMLERTLLTEEQKIKMFKFHKYSVYRVLNSFL